MKIHLKNKAFTLIELLIAMAIIGILATIGLGSFRTAQMRGRDAARKSDLKQISNALELYFSDHNTYPMDSSVVSDSGEFTDGETTYLKVIPHDPAGGTYVYQISSTGNKYRLFARLENTEDKNINPDITVSCGSSTCNFSITSPNTTPTDTTGETWGQYSL
jgi:prepilin-type N-terminal cleavage/methylation domain-containing protein